MPDYPCGMCKKSINDSKESSNFSDLCKFWVHSICSDLHILDFQHIKPCTELWFSFKCISEMFPFGAINNQNFSPFVINNKKNNTNTSCSLYLKPPPNLTLLFNQFNDLSSDLINKNPENMTNCKNYDNDDTQKIRTETISFSLYHLNTSSVNINLDNLEYFIKTANQTFNIIAVSESRVKSNMNITTNINLPYYCIEYTPTERYARGTSYTLVIT